MLPYSPLYSPPCMEVEVMLMWHAGECEVESVTDYGSYTEVREDLNQKDRFTNII